MKKRILFEEIEHENKEVKLKRKNYVLYDIFTFIGRNVIKISVSLLVTLLVSITVSIMMSAFVQDKPITIAFQEFIIEMKGWIR